MWSLGIGYRREIADWVESGAAKVDCLEITAEHFFDGGLDRLPTLRPIYPLLVHGLSLSLGTPGPLDGGCLARFVAVVRAADPLWISEHVAFTRAGGIDLGHLNPVPPTTASLRILADHARELSDRCEKRLILENITTHLRLDGEIDEPEFLNRLCDDSGCGLLLDVTNLAVNAKNHGFDPCVWLSRIDPRHVVQLHLAGYRKRGDRYYDLHADSVQQDIFELAVDVLARASPRAVVVERDTNFPRIADIAAELGRLEELRGH